MSEQEKMEAIATTGDVGEAKENILVRLWKAPLTKKIVKGVATVGACVGSAIIGYKAGTKHGPKLESLPEAADDDLTVVDEED